LVRVVAGIEGIAGIRHGLGHQLLFERMR
jgi:hypothetical protein